MDGYEYIFAIGDCCNTEENKMAAYADAHGLHVAGVIANTAKGKQVCVHFCIQNGCLKHMIYITHC